MKKGISGSDEDHHRHHLANFEVLKAIDRSLATITKSRHESRQSKQQQRLSVSIPQGQPRSSKTKNRLQAVQAMSTPDVVESHEGAGTTTQRIEEQVLETSSQSHYNAPPSQRNGSRGSSERRSSSTSSRNNNHAGVVGTKQTTDSSFWGDHAHQDQPDRTDSNDNTNHSATNREEFVDAPKPPSVAAPKEKGRPQPKSTTNDPKQQQPPAEQAKARGSSGDDAVPVVAPYPPKRIAAPLDDPIVLALELRLKERRAQEKHRNAEMARKAEVLQQQQERLREEREAREQERRDEDARKKQEQLDERLRLMKQKEEERAARVAQLHLKVDANVLDGKRSTLDIMEERKKKIAEEEQRVLEEKLKAIRQVKRGGGARDMMEDVRNHEILIAQKRAELAEHRKVHGPQHGAVSLEPIRQVDTKVMARILEEKQTAQGAAAEKKEIAKKRLEERRRYAPPPLPPIAVAVAPPASDDPTAHAMSELVSPASQQKKTPLGAHAWGHAPTGAVKKVVVSAPQPVPYRKPLQLNNGHSDERGALVPQPPNANKKSGGRAAAAPSSKRREGEGARDGDDASREEVRRTNDDAGEGSYNEPSFREDDDDHNNYGNGGRDDDDGATRKASVSQYTRAARHSEERQTDNERNHQVGAEEENQEHSSLSVDKVHEDDEDDVHPQYQTNSAPTEHRRASSGAPTRHSEHVEEIREGGGDELDDGAEDSHRSEGTHREEVEVEEEATHVDDVVDTGNAVLEQGDDDNEASAEQHGEAISNDNGQHHSSGADHNPPQGIEISEEQEHPQTPGDEQEPHRETDASVDVSQEAAVAPEEHDDDHDNDSHSGEPNDDETGMHQISLEIVGTSFKRASHTSQPSDAEVTQQGHPPSSSSAVSDASVHTTPSAARDPEATETTDHIASSNHLRGVDEDEEARRSAMSNRTTSHEGLEHRGTPNTGSEEITSSSSEKKERDHVVVEPTTISEISVNEDVSVVVAESSVQAPPRKTSTTGPKAAAAPTKASNVPAKKK